MKNTFLVIGLGNPGAAYIDTPHNIGRDFLIHSLAQHHETSWKSHKLLLADTASFVLDDTSVIYALPRLFMNDSGRAVSTLLKNLKITIPHCIIVHDDSDLVLGKIKVARASRPAGHHGIESITAILKTREIIRVRVGVRHPHEQSQAGTFVLKKFNTAERIIIVKKIYPDIESVLTSLISKVAAPSKSNRKE